MKAVKVLETCLYVDDLDGAERFYTGVLGLELYARAPGRHVFFRCGDGMFLVFNPAATRKRINGSPPHGAGSGGHVAFRMNEREIEAWRNHLKGRGVQIEEEAAWPGGGHSLYFRDPAGNSVELVTPRTWDLPESE